MTYSHRVAREFSLPDGTVAVVGSFVSDHDWTDLGRRHVEYNGWAIPLTPSEIAVLSAQERHNETVEETPVVAPAKAPAKKAPAKKAPAKKAATSTVKKTVK